MPPPPARLQSSPALVQLDLAEEEENAEFDQFSRGSSGCSSSSHSCTNPPPDEGSGMLPSPPPSATPSTIKNVSPTRHQRKALAEACRTAFDEMRGKFQPKPTATIETPSTPPQTPPSTPPPVTRPMAATTTAHRKPPVRPMPKAATSSAAATAAPSPVPLKPSPKSSVATSTPPRDAQHHVPLVVPSSVRKIPAAKWTSKQVTSWLELMGLEQYTYHFAANGVDGHTLFELNRAHVQQGLGITDPRHLISLEYGLLDLKERRFDGNLEVEWEWSCANVGDWLESRGLGVLKKPFAEGAVHGGVLFRLTEDQFVSLLGVGNDPLVLMSLLGSIDRARKVGSKPVSEADDAVLDWGPPRITKWLESLSLGHLDPVFRQHAVNGSILLSLTAPLMRDVLGLTDIQALVLERAVKRLARKHAQHSHHFYRIWKRLGLMGRFLTRRVQTAAPSLPQPRRRRSSMQRPRSPLKLSDVTAPSPLQGPPPRRRNSSQSLASLRKNSLASAAKAPVFVSRQPLVSPAHIKGDSAWFKHSPVSSASENGVAGEHSMVST